MMRRLAIWFLHTAPGRYIWNVGVGIDQLINAILFGDPDESISSRSAKAKNRGAAYGRFICWMLDWIDPGHCERYIEHDEGDDALIDY